ncbi:MAG: hypothetical protein M1817_002421 [Caeruleum heppii]|nr:MAG: hypothetical protein M1817_002421 [Caeruleum heppii]
MRVSTSILSLALSALVAAQGGPANPFNIPPEGLTASAGQATELKWEPTTSGTVTLILREGASSDLNPGTEIASNIPNSGSYSWTPPEDAVRGSDYTVQIVDDSNPANSNYSPYFVLDSSNTVASTTDASASPTPTDSASSTATDSSASSASSESSSASESSDSSMSSTSAEASSTSASESSSRSRASAAATSASRSTSVPGATSSAAAAGVHVQVGGVTGGIIGAVLGLLAVA